jgi:ATP-dependent protease ClpP protease subunit
MDLKKLTAQAEALREKTVAARQGSGKKWYTISNQGSDVTAVYIYDMIGEWGVTAQDFVNELNAVKTPSINLHVNSEGGQVFDGIAIFTAIKNHPATVTARVDALAASAASFIVQAADNRVMEPNARMMIHDAQGVVVGDAQAARSLADLLDETSENIASIYAERSGTESGDWRTAMQKDGGAGTWYSAQEAVDAGLADEVASGTQNSLRAPQMTAQAPQETTNSWSFDIAALIKETRESAV